MHLVSRTRPEIAKPWSPRDVARRWLTITRLAKCMSDELPQPNSKRVNKLVKDKKQIAQLRRRLSSVSWFIGILLENIARRANREDECTGRFFEARFKCRECTDLSSILLGGVYVDLNPTKAGEATGPRTARYTSVFQRLMAERQSSSKSSLSRPDGWMAELTRQPARKADEQLAYKSRTGRRASDMRILPISLAERVKLLEWTARRLKSGKRSTIPQDLATVLDQLNLNHEVWVDTVDSYDVLFCHPVGPPDSLARVAERMEVAHLKGTSAWRRVFT